MPRRQQAEQSGELCRVDAPRSDGAAAEPATTARYGAQQGREVLAVQSGLLEPKGPAPGDAEVCSLECSLECKG